MMHTKTWVYIIHGKNSDFISTIERFLFYYYTLPLPKYYTYFVKSALFFFSNFVQNVREGGGVKKGLKVTELNPAVD